MAVLKYEYNPDLVPERSGSFSTFFSLLQTTRPGLKNGWLVSVTTPRSGATERHRMDGRIEGMIANSWDNVASRGHRPAKIFAFSKDSLDVMIDGTTLYNWQDGSSKTGVWACRVAFKEVGGALKVSDYYVVFF